MRQIALDTETTGIAISEGHRVIEIGCVEIIDRRVTDNSFHFYINPECEVGEGAIAVHGITNEFLQDKPLFSEVAEKLIDYVKDAEVIIHNAPFDVGFLNHELKLTKMSLGKLTDYCEIFDTLVYARKMHPGQRNSLDALCRRYGVDLSSRTLHGALLDAELLANVYLVMTGGQSALFSERQAQTNKRNVTQFVRDLQNDAPLSIIKAEGEELESHKKFLKMLSEKSEGHCRWNEEENEIVTE